MEDIRNWLQWKMSTMESWDGVLRLEVPQDSLQSAHEAGGDHTDSIDRYHSVIPF